MANVLNLGGLDFKSRSTFDKPRTSLAKPKTKPGPSDQDISVEHRRRPSIDSNDPDRVFGGDREDLIESDEELKKGPDMIFDFAEQV